MSSQGGILGPSYGGLWGPPQPLKIHPSESFEN